MPQGWRRYEGNGKDKSRSLVGQNQASLGMTVTSKAAALKAAALHLNLRTLAGGGWRR